MHKPDAAALNSDVMSRAIFEFLGGLVDLEVIGRGNLSCSFVARGPSSAMLSFDTSIIADFSIEESLGLKALHL
jgi:hypothetical protein